MPVEYRKALAEMERRKQAEASPRVARRRGQELQTDGQGNGFLEIDRRDRKYLPAAGSRAHWREFMIPLGDQATRDQAARCMNCGIPFCHNGCPVNNQIPDWNDLVYRGDWLTALKQSPLDQQFPRVHRPHLPGAVRGSLHAQPHRRAGDHQDDRMRHRRPRLGGRLDQARAAGAPQTGSSVAVVGSGPAGLACAQQLARAGHEVHLYEKNAKPGGLLRYGIPDFKMEKHHVERRVAQMEAEGVIFHCNVHVGVDARRRTSSASGTTRSCLPAAPRSRATCRSRGANSQGIHFAMDFLPQQNRRVSDEPLGNVEPILAGGKHVIVIGGGDTGSDCIGTSFRQGALSVTQLEIMPRAARAREQAADLAGLAAEAPHLVEPGRGRRPRLRR